MQCPNCGAPATEQDVFCGACGAALNPAAQPTQPLQQPVPVPSPVAPQPTQAMPPAAPPPSGPSAQYPAAAAPPPPTKSHTGLIVTLSIVGVLLVIGLAVGGFFGWRALSSDDATSAEATSTSAPAPDSPEPDPAAEPSGYATAAEALAEYMPADWVSDFLTQEADLIEYIIGPPNSEYVEVVVVARQPDGTWLIEDTYDYQTGDMAGTDTMSPEDEAIQVTGEFIYAVQEDRADDAHKLTITPFAEDPASAQYSNGDLESFEITDAQLQSDGTTVWVRSSERWAWGTESYIYICVPTANGYRISELRIP